MAKLSDFRPDPGNLNKGSQRGIGRLEKSLQDYGFGRPILAAADGTIIAGNHTLEAAAGMGMTKVRVVETDGTEIIIHKRTDLDSDDTKTKLLGLADNRVGQLNWNVDVTGLAELAGLDSAVLDFYSKNELDLLQGLVEPPTESSRLPTNPEMATSPAWAHGSDDEDYGDEDSDDDLTVENAGRERMLNAGPEDEDDEDDEPEVLAGRPVPLPIVLLPAEMRQWRKAKDQLGYSRDKAAFLKMVEQYLEQIEPAAESELN